VLESIRTVAGDSTAHPGRDGTGKEMIARAITAEPARGRLFVSELRGHPFWAFLKRAFAMRGVRSLAP